VAAALTANAPERGINARAFSDAAQEELDGQETFLTMLQGYLGLGLLIGVAGLSVVLVRAVRERRRQIGMMRAIGIPASQVRSMFVVEAVFIGLQGVVLGLGLGTLSSWQILTKSSAFERGLGFTVPVLWLGGLAAFGIMVSVLAAIGPALLAGKESPAEALRFSG
jgi:putative ABC transport system permease protein